MDFLVQLTCNVLKEKNNHSIACAILLLTRTKNPSAHVIPSTGSSTNAARKAALCKKSMYIKSDGTLNIYLTVVLSTFLCALITIAVVSTIINAFI